MKRHTLSELSGMQLRTTLPHDSRLMIPSAYLSGEA